MYVYDDTIQHNEKGKKVEFSPSKILNVKKTRHCLVNNLRTSLSPIALPQLIRFPSRLFCIHAL